MNPTDKPAPFHGTVPCDKCLDQFIATRHQLHQQITRWQRDYMQMKGENERLRARLAEMVEAEIRLRLDRQDAGKPTITLGQKLRQAISKQEGAAS